MLVFGTRPEAIKMAPLYLELKKRTGIETKVCVTAQHRGMLDQVLELFDILPDYDLDIMKANQDLYDITANVLLKLKDVFTDFKPEYVFVHGDTTTTFAASLAAFYQKIKVCHVEAGLRTGDIYSPWPEEANRKLTTQITSFHFAPTEVSKENLVNENVAEKDIVVTGNSVVDALFHTLEKIHSDDQLQVSIKNLISEAGYEFSSGDKKIILVTGHRRENFGEGFLNICRALKVLAEKLPSFDIVYPVHLNPNVLGPVTNELKSIDNVHLIKPLQYESFIYLMNQAHIVLTDSGGIQEEAPSLGKPVFVMRDTTERPEAISAGTVKLVGTDTDKIVNSIMEVVEDSIMYNKMAKAHNPYGDGKACERIADFITRC